VDALDPRRRRHGRAEGCAVIERRDGTCELPIAAAEISIDRTAHAGYELLTTKRRKERLLMQTRAGDQFLDSDAEAYSFAFGWSRDGDG
jgi:hypothetical protein